MDHNFVRSVRQMRHPVLYVPDFMLFLTTLVFGLGFFKVSGLSHVLESLALTEGFQAELFKGLLADKWFTIILASAVFFITTFLIGIGADIVRFSLIKNIIHKKDIGLLKAWNEGKHLFWDVVVLKVLVYLLSLAVLLILALIGAAIYLLVGSLGSPVFTVPLVVVGLVMLVLLKLFLFFRYPVLFIERHKSPARVIRDSFLFAKSNFRYTFLVALVLVIILVLFSVVTAPVAVGLDYVQGLVAVGFLGSVFAYFSKMVKALVNLLYAIWAHLFVFNSYISKRKK